ncbi:dimethylaniline monooxygenase [N-oxide-forming] [Elysia marginata]|uniref:Flavin-containing monooxygenase n=1 Tax=Elysia marginata TaxID=1093978 RepID=A0AAV4G2R1_9GAST|nr:dimethylaniline monooxygenase [N-oxide-forming] [Elysia marginata]
MKSTSSPQDPPISHKFSLNFSSPMEENSLSKLLPPPISTQTLHQKISYAKHKTPLRSSKLPKTPSLSTCTTNPKASSNDQSPSFPEKRRVLIVGAGCSGLAAIKSCLDEGLQPLCIERSTDIGGLWNYKDNDATGNAGIYRSLVINTSKEMMMFSDFPPPESFPPFLTHEKVLEYFRLYANHFGLLRYIRFGAEVRRVSKADDYQETGRWKVEYVWRRATRKRSRGISTDEAYNSSDTESDTIQTTDSTIHDLFDGVMICTGHHSVPYIPQIPGLAAFQGHVLHSRSYKESAPFLGKRVVILGMGNSAVDIACDLAKSAKQVYLSSRRGCWLVPRTTFWGLPADMLANSRVVFTLPYRLLDWLVQVQANFRVDHEAYGLRPHHG